ncbi:MAG TPA: CoA-binding protein [Leptospiraceae bacterium]|nr:CoA-binding protein [Leptospiraceae bacterium]HMW05833.1 CoA-binding protein [Leptospiraceae bacterium]HMX33577.1 CoA-binding protein [Leptospiraceae bacterium]HMY34375.1 CoA-binding protein [Leptospiraceae bacterium]HMZ64131.1 CoA-binding protein [Leptospiraceae bacterium]
MKENKVLELLNKKDCTIAIVGATNDSSKYGNIIYKDLKGKNIKVYGINPKATTIDGDKAYHTLDDLGFKPDIIDMVIPPKLGLALIQDAVSKGYDNFWLQPGAESDEIIQFLEDKGKNYLAYSCVMVESR